MTFEEVMRDTGALGGLAFYLVCILALAVTEQISLAFALFVALAIAYALLVPLRLIFPRTRPDKQKHANFFQRINANSFPSTHAMRAAILATFFSFFFLEKFINIYFTIISITAAGLVGWTRIYFKRHYWSDVVVGWILGTALGIAAVAAAAPFALTSW